ncbi:pyridoxal phosphate-dependent aminotransferase [Pusillimonas sp. DMV24BSW_D]|uniref:pyridoxal phosphate-dependent aminotransferase n=1 Tax=Neopusillimonas aestuarii TaxID=2716226 RepID=UPI001409ADC8|nr:pyridoxal phosphate-dependent aminotransferase [Pusillimonas sp. DMV24BSW_D]QIM48880.1 pyridoxal phosphate-dependent aminotransferase [Pusillimonas sp. DMV24BSW_D]
MPELAQRCSEIQPFYAVEVFKQGAALIAQGHDIISLGIGEPDFTAPAQVVETLNRASSAGLSGYTPPLGLAPLREAIAHYYGEEFGARVKPERIIVTSGASGALLLACTALINPGAEILMPDPSYPANQNFIRCAGGRPKLIPCGPEQQFQLTAHDIETHWGPDTRGVVIASPSNPTGTRILQSELKKLIEAVHARGGFVIMDEIYLGLYYDEKPESALTLDDNLIIINSFSKYFHMTGWRLGWMIVPETMIAAIDKLAASLTICAPSLAQHAALSCFEPEVMRVYENRRLSFKQRRDYLVPELEKMGLTVPVKPDGAFYVYADVSRHSNDSEAFSQQMLAQAHVAAVPGRDFGPAHAQKMLRFSYTLGLNRLEEAVGRIAQFLR